MVSTVVWVGLAFLDEGSAEEEATDAEDFDFVSSSASSLGVFPLEPVSQYDQMSSSSAPPVFC